MVMGQWHRPLYNFRFLLCDIFSYEHVKYNVSQCSHSTCFSYRQVVTVPVKDTNLLLAVTEPLCEGLEPMHNIPTSNKPYRVSEDEARDLICYLARHPHKTVHTYDCYDSDPGVSTPTHSQFITEWRSSKCVSLVCRTCFLELVFEPRFFNYDLHYFVW